MNRCLMLLDTLKFLIAVAWEGRLISNRHCQDISSPLEEAGRMLGGWKRSLESPEKKNRNS